MDEILYQLKKIIPRWIFRLFQPAYHWLLALLSALLYKFPSKKLIVIGITGTNGKSTSVALLHEVLSRAGYKTGSLSSIRFKIRNKEVKNELKMTIPGRGRVQKFLADCIKEGCQFAVLEVTSEGIRQFRHMFVNFDLALITNVTPEHIESHGGFEAYRNAKAGFFRYVAESRRKVIGGRVIPKTLVVNLDDKEYAYFLPPAGDRFIGYTLQGKSDPAVNSSVQAEHPEVHEDGVSFLYKGKEFKSPLRGRFNLENLAGVLAVAENFSIPLAAIQEAFLETANVPGRFEYIEEGQVFRVIVDYAHTPDALEKVYQATKSTKTGGQIICVLGAAGGGRDVWKRPEMGTLAEQFCDQIILTNEDPYDEDPEAILHDVAKGFSSAVSPELIIDRRAAINRALQSAKPGDTVIITGKGAEPWLMGPKNSKIPWDDRAVVREELKKI